MSAIDRWKEHAHAQVDSFVEELKESGRYVESDPKESGWDKNIPALYDLFARWLTAEEDDVPGMAIDFAFSDYGSYDDWRMDHDEG